MASTGLPPATLPPHFLHSCLIRTRSHPLARCGRGLLGLRRLLCGQKRVVANRPLNRGGMMALVRPCVRFASVDTGLAGPANGDVGQDEFRVHQGRRRDGHGSGRGARQAPAAMDGIGRSGATFPYRVRGCLNRRRIYAHLAPVLHWADTKGVPMDEITSTAWFNHRHGKGAVAGFACPDARWVAWWRNRP